MTDLEQNLREILNEKETKIIPENIKKDVTIFGVTGNVESGLNIEPAEYIDVFCDNVSLAGLGDPGYVQYTVTGEENIPEQSLINGNTELTVKAPQFMVAEAIGLTADKIKKGETILKIDGTYEDGGTTDIPVKLFSSVEEMNSSTNNDVGDLAVLKIEGGESRVELDVPYATLTFPKTVVLPEKFTLGTTPWGYGHNEDYSTDITPSFDGEDLVTITYRANNSDTNNIIYSTTDGITYTALETNDDIVMMSDTPITFVSSEQVNWSDLLSYFIQAVSPALVSLYKYNGTSWDKVQEEIDGQIIRSYESIEDMQAANVNMNDLGLVQVETYRNAKIGDTIRYVKLPKTVVLPEALPSEDTNYYYEDLITIDGTSYSYGLELDGMGLWLFGYGIDDVNYHTEDRKTYTIDEEQIIDLGTDFTIAEQSSMGETWSDLFGHFLQVPDKYIVEIYCYGTEGWELVLSSNIGGEEGSLPEPTELLQLSATEVMRKGLGAAGIVLSASGLEFPVYLDNNSTIEIEASQEAVAEAFGITPDIIKAGETVLGISGTYTGE